MDFWYIPAAKKRKVHAGTGRWWCSLHSERMTLSLRDCGTLCVRANRREKRKDHSVDAQSAVRRGVAWRKRRAGSNHGSVRFYVRGEEQGFFRDMDCGLRGRGRMFHES